VSGGGECIYIVGKKFKVMLVQYVDWSLGGKMSGNPGSWTVLTCPKGHTAETDVKHSQLTSGSLPATMDEFPYKRPKEHSTIEYAITVSSMYRLEHGF
jgi:hypothetical protein